MNTQLFKELHNRIKSNSSCVIENINTENNTICFTSKVIDSMYKNTFNHLFWTSPNNKLYFSLFYNSYEIGYINCEIFGNSTYSKPIKPISLTITTLIQKLEYEFKTYEYTKINKHEIIHLLFGTKKSISLEFDYNDTLMSNGIFLSTSSNTWRISYIKYNQRCKLLHDDLYHCSFSLKEKTTRFYKKGCTFPLKTMSIPKKVMSIPKGNEREKEIIKYVESVRNYDIRTEKIIRALINPTNKELEILIDELQKKDIVREPNPRRYSLLKVKYNDINLKKYYDIDFFYIWDKIKCRVNVYKKFKGRAFRIGTRIIVIKTEKEFIRFILDTYENYRNQMIIMHSNTDNITTTNSINTSNRISTNNSIYSVKSKIIIETEGVYATKNPSKEEIINKFFGREISPSDIQVETISINDIYDLLNNDNFRKVIEDYITSKK